MKVEALRKITLKGVAGKVDLEALIKSPEKHFDLAKIYGTARRAKEESFQMPDGKVSNFIRFIGRFQALNIATGEIFEAGACILPGIAQDLLAGELGSDGSKEVMFAFLIGVNYVKDASVPFEYTVTSLVELTEDDPMLRIAHAIGVNIPAAAPVLPPPDDPEDDETKKGPANEDVNASNEPEAMPKAASAKSGKNSRRNR
jgi:hypothetical protein